jgi:1-aminocyclopropane-1-carboxylate deaminase/D-cysteine desulfhydrase-like pyridoxal-dependent ACC family enzyme
VDTELGGNKWRKLKYNIEAAYRQNHDTLLTFGGAWSNHIYATAAAGKRLGFHTIGIIRGEKHNELNHTLQFATDCGMQLEYVDRKTYRQKASHDYISHLHNKYGQFYLLPEGGSNALAIQGCSEIVYEINTFPGDKPFDTLCVASGTGATLAGLAKGIQTSGIQASNISTQQTAMGFAVLKDAKFLSDDVASFLQQAEVKPEGNWQINTDYHFGGYAKTSSELWAFMETFNNDFNIPLDAVYTGKMFYGLFDLIKKGYFTAGSRIVAIHTGGLQGNKGFEK